MPNKFYPEEQTMIHFRRFSSKNHALLEKKMVNFFQFQSISILAIRGNRRQETVSVP